MLLRLVVLAALGFGFVACPLASALVPPLGLAVGAQTSASSEPEPTPAVGWTGASRVAVVFEPSLEAPALSRLEALGIPFHPYERLHMAAALADPGTLTILHTMPGVLGVYAEEEMQPMLSRSVGYVGARIAWNTYGVTGRGVGILVVDSGIDGTHPDTKYGANLVANVAATRQSNGLVGGTEESMADSDLSGHGTHVASIAAGSGAGSSGQTYRGVAPGATLLGYRAGTRDPSTGNVRFESLHVLEAFDWALENQERYGIRVVTNSWGLNGAFDARNPVNIATLKLYEAGMVVVFAAGNEGEEGERTLNKYAVAPWVLAVGAGDYLNQLAYFDSRGSDPAVSGLAWDHPDLVAPGVGIVAARANAASRSATRPSTLYAEMSGSSMAAPAVAGTVALLLEANPNLSPDDVMDVLAATATPLPNYAQWEAGAGYLNALMSVQLARKVDGHRSEFLDGRAKYAGPASGDPDFARDAVTVGLFQGAARQLHSPNPSLAAFLARLVTSAQGWLFLGGLAGHLAATFGRGPSGTSKATTTPRRVRAVLAVGRSRPARGRERQRSPISRLPFGSFAQLTPKRT